MRKNLLYSLLSLCAVLLFWACGEGVVESAEDSDHLALERYGNLTAADVIDALEQCKGNKECESQITQAFRDNPISKKDPVDEDTVVSSSSVKDSVLSSSSLSIKSSSSVTDSLSSSAPADSLSSSVNEESSSSVEESSSSAPESSSSVEESSSSAPESSSSVEESSSSEPESSSSEEEESSSSEEVILPLGGTCKPVDRQAYVGDTVVWQYIKNEGTRDGKEYEWENLDGARGTGFQTTSVPMVGMVFDSPLDKTFPLLTVDGQDMGECVSVKIVARPVESSSSVTSSPSSSPTSGTSSSVRSSSSTPQSSSSEGCKINYMGEVECPSSSSVTPSSSSVVSSSSEPPSSSSQESSSSEESSSSVEPESSSSTLYTAENCATYCPNVGCGSVAFSIVGTGWASSQSHCIFLETKPDYINADCAVTINGTGVSGYVASFADSDIGYYVEVTGSNCYWDMDMK